MSTTGYFSFTLRKQPFSNAASATLAKHPKIAEPFFTCKNHSHNLSVDGGYPGETPVFFVDRNRSWAPDTTVDLVHHVLYDRSNEIELIGLGPPHEHCRHHEPIYLVGCYTAYTGLDELSSPTFGHTDQLIAN